MSISVSPGTILMTHVCLGVCMFMCTCEHLWVCMCMRFFVNYMLLSQTLCVGWLNRSWIQRGRVLFLSHAANNLEVFFTFEREQGRERKKKSEQSLHSPEQIYLDSAHQHGGRGWSHNTEHTQSHMRSAHSIITADGENSQSLGWYKPRIPRFRPIWTPPTQIYLLIPFYHSF